MVAWAPSARMLFSLVCVRALRHEDDCFLSQLICRPRNAAAVVSVRGGKEGRLAEFFFQLFGCEHIIRKFGYVFSGLLCYVARHGEGTAEHFESVQPEAVGFIL